MTDSSQKLSTEEKLRQLFINPKTKNPHKRKRQIDEYMELLRKESAQKKNNVEFFRSLNEEYKKNYDARYSSKTDDSSKDVVPTKKVTLDDTKKAELIYSSDHDGENSTSIEEEIEENLKVAEQVQKKAKITIVCVDNSTQKDGNENAAASSQVQHANVNNVTILSDPVKKEALILYERQLEANPVYGKNPLPHFTIPDVVKNMDEQQWSQFLHVMKVPKEKVVQLFAAEPPLFDKAPGDLWLEDPFRYRYGWGEKKEKDSETDSSNNTLFSIGYTVMCILLTMSKTEWCLPARNIEFLYSKKNITLAYNVMREFVNHRVPHEKSNPNLDLVTQKSNARFLRLSGRVEKNGTKVGMPIAGSSSGNVGKTYTDAKKKSPLIFAYLAHHVRRVIGSDCLLLYLMCLKASPEELETLKHATICCVHGNLGHPCKWIQILQHPHIGFVGEVRQYAFDFKENCKQFLGFDWDNAPDTFEDLMKLISPSSSAQLVSSSN